MTSTRPDIYLKWTSCVGNATFCQFTSVWIRILIILDSIGDPHRSGYVGELYKITNGSRSRTHLLQINAPKRCRLSNRYQYFKNDFHYLSLSLIINLPKIVKYIFYTQYIIHTLYECRTC